MMTSPHFHPQSAPRNPHSRLRSRILHGVFVSLAIALFCARAQADVYRIESANGVTIFTNIPTNQEKKLIREEKLKPVMTGAPSAATAAALPRQPFYLTSAEHRTRYAEHIRAAARASNVEPALIRAVISAESGYNPSARSAAGAVGLMQLMPETARRYGVTNRLDPVQSIQGGTRYLGDLLAMFNNDLHLAVAAYNAGEKAVMNSGNKIPPYRETVDYVPRVMTNYKKYRSSRQ